MSNGTQIGHDLLALLRTWHQGGTAWEPATPDAAALWRQVRRHGLDGMAGALAARGGTVPEALVEPANAAYCTIALRARQAELLGQRLGGVAQAEGRRLSCVKGLALVAAYGDDGVRGFGDIDVLIEQSDTARLLADRCGLTVPPEAGGVPAPFWRRMRSVGRIEARGGAFAVEFTTGHEPASDALHDICRDWPDQYFLSVGSEGRLPVPAPAAHLLFLLQHLGLHWFNRLIWLADVAVLMRNGAFDAAWLEHAAARLEMRKMLRAVTVFCRRYLDESLCELGVGPTGWKDGLYLAMLAPDAWSRTALFKYAHTPGSGARDILLGALQTSFASDHERPVVSRDHCAPRWVTDWLQYVIWPGGTWVARLTRPVVPALYGGMVAMVCLVFRRLPGRLAREARRELRPRAGRMPDRKVAEGVPEPC